MRSASHSYPFFSFISSGYESITFILSLYDQSVSFLCRTAPIALFDVSFESIPQMILI